MTENHLTSLQPGTVIGGKYEVVRCLGAGSMGMVYACRHRDLQGQLVAAKVLFREVALDAVAAARFKNEILASYGVSHPNVVRAYEFIRDGDLIAYTMEFIGGGDLADRMSRPELVSIAEILRLLSQMAAGVQAIHDAGIVHRDLKPENILLTNDGAVKIADFGIARKTDGPKLTEHGGVVGTLEYVSPEYMLRSQVDWRSDIYALGVLAFELITGEPPFKGDSAYASISKRLQTDPEPPSKYRSECPSGLDHIVLKALQRDPEERYQSAVEIFYDVQQVATSLGVSNASASGVLIPPASTIAGKRYVGPTLSRPMDASGQLQETQVLTSDGSIEYSAGSGGTSGAALTDSASRAFSNAGLVEDYRLRQTTDYLGPSGQFGHESRGGSSGSVGASNTSQGAVLGGATPMRADEVTPRRGATKPAAPFDGGDFSVDLLKRSKQRLRILDGMILLFAALSGIGAGYLFLRVFAPSFLEKLNLLGLGS
jgi:serine/threonine protein kinase